MGSRARGSRGSALAEILIATLLAAIVTAGVFMSVLTSRRTTERADSRSRAAAAAKRMIDQVGNYATPVADASTVALAPGGSWALAGAPCGSAWALNPTGGADGCEVTNVADFLPPEFRANQQARMWYKVENVNLSGMPFKRVTVKVQWQDAQ